jgi:hypothetical protein
MNDADLWEALTKAGVRPDSATAIVMSHRRMSNADLWERVVANGASPDAATTIVRARSASPSAAAPTASTASANTDVSLRNVGRAFTQGATLGFGDELGLTDRDAEKAFKQNHPGVDFAAKFLGGALAPAAAALLAPEAAATAGGAALIGAGAGALSGIGEGETPKERAIGGVVGGTIGAAGGLLGRGVSSVVGKIADRINPSRTVTRAAGELLTPDVAQRMAEVNALAPGGASIASSTAPQLGARTSRFMSMARGVGANPDAAAAAEAAVTTQRTALKLGQGELGAKMDALAGDIPVTRELRDAIVKARDVLGAKVPKVLADAPADANPLGLEKSVPFSFDEETPTLDVQDLRDVLSRLRYLSRQAEKRGVEANGITTRDINDARDAVQRALYRHAPGFAPLDRNYALLSDQVRQVDRLIKTIQLSRQNYAGNTAYGATAGSLGGSLPHGAQSATLHLLEHLLTNRSKAADAVYRSILLPAGADAVQRFAPTSTRVMNAVANGAFASGASRVAGLLGLPDEP